MQKPLLFALLLAVSGAACQAFTAGETVAPPDPAQVRAQLAAKSAAKRPTPSAMEQAHAGLEMATASHILIRYAGALRTTPDITRSKEEAKKLADEVAAKAKAPGADFEALANQYTEDPSGKGRGGTLGTFAKGRMVPEFDKAVFGLPPGGVSDVVESAFGFHIIYREK